MTRGKTKKAVAIQAAVFLVSGILLLVRGKRDNLIK
jgi:hypothetical protein